MCFSKLIWRRVWGYPKPIKLRQLKYLLNQVKGIKIKPRNSEIHFIDGRKLESSYQNDSLRTRIINKNLFMSSLQNKIKQSIKAHWVC